MKYLKIRKMERPFYFTYEKVCEIMKEYLPDIGYFYSFIDNSLHEEHCCNTRCSECAFRTRSESGQLCSLVAPKVKFVSTDRCWISNEHARGLVEGLNKTREICSEHVYCDCNKCWLRDGPAALYLCGGRDIKNKITSWWQGYKK